MTGLVKKRGEGQLLELETHEAGLAGGFAAAPGPFVDDGARGVVGARIELVGPSPTLAFEARFFRGASSAALAMSWASRHRPTSSATFRWARR